MIRRYSLSQTALRTGLDEAEVRYYAVLFREFFRSRVSGNCPIIFPDEDLELFARIHTFLKVQKLTLEETRIELRRAASGNENSAGDSPHHAPMLGIASGRRGVGKTIIAAQLAMALVRKGKNVMLLADSGIPVESQPVEIHSHLRTFRLSSIFEAATSFDPDAWKSKVTMLAAEERAADYIIIDCGSGRTETALRFAPFVDEMFLVTGADVAANADCFAAVRVLHELDRDLPLGLIINRVQSGEEARDCMLRLRAIARRMIGREISELGFVTENEGLATGFELRQGGYSEGGIGAGNCFHALAEQVMIHCARLSRNEHGGLQALAQAWRSRSYEKVAELASC